MPLKHLLLVSFTMYSSHHEYVRREVLRRREFNQVICRSSQWGCIYVWVLVFTLQCHEPVTDHVLTHDSRPGLACLTGTVCTKSKFVIFLLLKLIIYDKKLFRSRGRTVVGYRGLKLGKSTALWGKKKKTLLHIVFFFIVPFLISTEVEAPLARAFASYESSHLRWNIHTLPQAFFFFSFIQTELYITATFALRACASELLFVKWNKKKKEGRRKGDRYDRIHEDGRTDSPSHACVSSED